MDKHEAESLAARIQAASLDWIQVRAVELNRLSRHYEVRCAYKLGAPYPTSRWVPLRITSSHHWLELLKEQRQKL
jgi:hypothetical protein